MLTIRNLISQAKTELATRPALERGFFVFWLLGPFIYLIERSPADIWLTLIALVFLGRSIIKKDWGWTQLFWVRMVGLFWASLFISAAFSSLPGEAFVETISWIRFPLFAVASLYWFGRSPALLRMLMLTTAMGLAIMVLILSAELYFNYAIWSVPGTSGGRLTWPYGDPVPGNYLAKFGLVVVVALSVIASGKNRLHSYGALIALAILLAATILSGERINSILVLASFGLALVWLNHDRLAYLAAIIGLTGALIGTVISTNDFLKLKFTSNFIDGIFDVANSGYYHLWNTGMQVFKSSPITGIGAGMFRSLCQEIQYPSDMIVRCDNHPHQYYIQVLSEAGLIGLVTFVLMIASLIYYMWRVGRGTGDNFQKLCFIIPLALFFPLQATADVFGQWVNLMIWYSIGFALAISNVGLSNSKTTPSIGQHF